VLTGAYRDLLTAVAGAGAALTGLLFVALSVTQSTRLAGYPAVIRDVRAASSIVAFTNVLTVSLFGLVPNNNTGYAAIVTAVIGILFTLAAIRSIVVSADTSWSHVRSQAGLIALLLAAFGFELGGGVQLVSHPASTGGAQTICNVLVGLLIIGIARAWELVGDRGTGILSSLAVLAGRDSPRAADRAGNDASAAADAVAGDDAG
jgi:modulator of FtsH protease